MRRTGSGARSRGCASAGRARAGSSPPRPASAAPDPASAEARTPAAPAARRAGGPLREPMLCSTYLAFRGIERSPGSAPPVRDRVGAAPRLRGGGGDPRSERRRTRSGRGNRRLGALPARGSGFPDELLDDGRWPAPPGLPPDAARARKARARAQGMAGVLRRSAGGDGVIDEYLAQFRRDLRERGVRGAAADRALAEARDHLIESGDVESFGPSDRIAKEIAAQLATTRTIRSTY